MSIKEVSRNHFQIIVASEDEVVELVNSKYPAFEAGFVTDSCVSGMCGDIFLNISWQIFGELQFPTFFLEKKNRAWIPNLKTPLVVSRWGLFF